MKTIAAVGMIAVLLGACSSGDPSQRTASEGRQRGLAEGAAGAFGPGGVTVTGSGEVVVPADEAFVLFTVDSGMPGALSARDRREVQDGLADGGIPVEDITISSNAEPYSSMATIRVKVPVEQLPEIAESVDDIVTDVMEEAVGGLVFGVQDCTAKLAPARTAATATAESAAAALATVARVRLGALRSAVEVPALEGYPPTWDPCDPAAPTPSFPSDSGAPFDAVPEVRLTYAVRATYAIDGVDSSEGLTAGGSATIRREADRATVVLMPYEWFDSEGTARADRSDTDSIVDAVTALGIDPADVEIITGADHFSGGPTVLVHIGADDLDELGDAIVEAVSDVVGDVDRSGVVFSSSDCAALVGDARAEALEHAQEQLDALAEAAKVQLGQIVQVAAEPLAAEYGFGASNTDPCDPRDAIEQGAAYGQPLALLDFDSPAITTVTANVSITRAIA